MYEATASVTNIPGVGTDGAWGDGHATARAATSAELHRLRRFALVAAGRILQGVVMIAAGGFLLREIPTTPGLTLQMGILGLLLVGGGVASVHAGLAGPTVRSTKA